MNFLARSVMNLARTCIASSIQEKEREEVLIISSSLTKLCGNTYSQGNILRTTSICMSTALQGLGQIRFGSTLRQLHKRGPFKKRKPSKNPLDGNPFMKGIVLKTVIRKPKKPNSANRKCVVVRLSNGKEMTAYVPGVGHNLQEHNIVLCRNGRLRDTPGVKIKCVRGKYDLPHVTKNR